MRRIFFIAVCWSTIGAQAQSFGWWAQNVHWDGVSHWSHYLITQAAYFGPNALPVPRIGNGDIDSSISISTTASFHFSKGDKTQNAGININYCLVKDIIAFDLSWVPYEHFKMDHATKEKRRVFSDSYYDKQATGDMQLNTTIRLLKKWRPAVQMALRMGYRFPTGTGLPAARYTDAPGYYFDLSIGKPLSHSPLKWISMVGFYSWQIISDKHRQDDAFLFGSGVEWNHPSIRMQTYIAGYIGYLHKGGDKPIVFRSNWEKKCKRYSWLAGFQQGMHDFGYTTAELGIKYYFK